MRETGEHIKVFVAGPRGSQSNPRNLCNVLRGDSPGPPRIAPSLPVTGEAPRYLQGTGFEQCKTCRARLVDLGLALEALALTTETRAVRERAFAARRWGWHRDSFLKQVEGLAAAYRRMAEDVETQLARKFPVGLEVTEAEGRAFQLASELHHQQAWSIANAGLDTLVRAAVELDQTAREAR